MSKRFSRPPSPQVPPRWFRTVIHQRSAALAPIVVTGVDVDGDTATARFRARDGGVRVARVTVDSVAPHRIVHTSVQTWVPGHLTPALPQRFADDLPSPDAGVGPRLVVFAGLCGSGKSAVAEGVGAAWGVPVFSLDWLLGALTPFGLYHRPDLMGVGDELLMTRPTGNSQRAVRPSSTPPDGTPFPWPGALTVDTTQPPAACVELVTGRTSIA